jgi:hypothetical protein
LDNVRRYQKSKRGKEVISRSKISFSKTHPDYYRDYMRKKRKDARRKGICTHCFKREVMNGMLSCYVCVEDNRDRYDERFRRREQDGICR